MNYKPHSSVNLFFAFLLFLFSDELSTRATLANKISCKLLREGWGGGGQKMLYALAYSPSLFPSFFLIYSTQFSILFLHFGEPRANFWSNVLLPPSQIECPFLKFSYSKMSVHFCMSSLNSSLLSIMSQCSLTIRGRATLSIMGARDPLNFSYVHFF